MKTIVLLFLLLVALTAVTASRGKKHKAQEDTDGPEDSRDWPQPESIGEFGVPPEYGGPPLSEADPPAEGGDPPTRKSHARSGRRSQN